ncbi:MAG TPA: sugar-transfer associated ATP-grasp domain-containing protein, partial [Candidatus Dojkabacteria bacterium]|nr:sugar-transfer associated ATP-grasp domain-containing protein [Candidatus Dojkabacteria bacterium]
PIMAMMRLPTKKSNGTANLHSGAICTGIDISSGITTYSMHIQDKSLISDSYEMIDSTLDLKENKKLAGIQIPYWEQILEIAVKCQKASKLGYIGVDIALDAEKGPIVFELNARPGLGIQVANQAGLRWRLEKVKDIEIKSMKHGIRVAKNLFGGEVEESIEAISGRKVVNINEKIFLYYKTPVSKKKNDPQNREAIRVFVDTGLITSRINKTLASRIGFFEAIKYFYSLPIPDKFESFKDAQEYIDSNQTTIIGHPDILRVAKIVEEGTIKIRPVICVHTKIANEEKEIEMVVTEDTTYNVVIGRNELKGYLIDTSKTFT